MRIYVGAGGGDLEGPLGVLLAADIGEVAEGRAFSEERLFADLAGGNPHRSFENLHCINEGCSRVDDRSIGDGRFGCIRLRHDHAVDTAGTHVSRHGEDAVNGAQRAIQ